VSGGEELEQAEGSLEARVSASLADAVAGRLTRHQSAQALMEHLEGGRNAIGRVMSETVSHQTENIRMAPLGEITAPKIDQGGPVGSDDFVYVDISSVDNKLKRITDPKSLAAKAAPSRAKQRLKGGDVMVSMTRPNLNAVAIVPAELDGAVGSTGFHVLRANEGTEPRWLYYAVQTQGFISAMSELVQGALYPAVRPKDIRAFEIPHPPVDQQKRIIAEIEKQFSRLDEAVANLKRVKANLKRYKAAVLKAAVEGRLVETEAELARREGRSYETGAQLLQRILETRRSQWQGKGKYKEPAAPDTTGLPELPEGWVWARLDAIAVLKGGITVDSKRKDSTARSVPYLRVANVQRGYLDLAEVKFIDAPESEIEALRLLPGDILFNEGGDRDKLGRGWIWEGQLADCVHQNHVFRARLYLNQLSPKLVSWWGNTFGKDYFSREGKQTTNLASINLTKLSAFPIPLPPTAEQKEIVAEVDLRLSLIRTTEAQVDANLQRAERLRQSILAQAFSGRLKLSEESVGEVA
jgi:type I restriction enzyme S subunit